MRAELVKIAKAQRSLDNEKSTQQTAWRERHKKLTERLSAIGISRQAFAQPYQNFNRIQNAEDDDAKKQAQEKNVVYLAQQRTCYDALNVGEQLDWVNLVDDAAEIEKRKEEEEREHAEAAAEGGTEAVDTPAEV